MDREQYGLYKQAFLIVTTAMSVLPMGVPMSAFYFLARDPTHRRETVLNVMLFHAAIAGAACAALAFCPSILLVIFHDSGLAPYSAWIGVIILFWITGAFLDIVPVANDEIRLASALIVAIQGSRAAMFVAAVLIFGTLRALFAAAVLHGLVQTLVLFWYLQSRFTGFWRAFRWRALRDQLSYALPLGSAALLMIVQTDLHNYLVSNHFGPAMFAVYSIGTVQLPLMGMIWEASNSVLITRVSAFEKAGEYRQIVLMVVRAGSKLAALFFPVYAFLMVAGREFIRLLFTERFAGAWPIFALNLTLLPMRIVLLDPIYRAFERERFFLLRVRMLLAAALTIALCLCTARVGPIGVIAIVIVIAAMERVIMGVHFGRLLGVTHKDAVLLGDIAKIAIASVAAAAVAASIRLALIAQRPLIVLAACGSVFAAVYVATVVRWLRVPFINRFTSAAVSSR